MRGGGQVVANVKWEMMHFFLQYGEEVMRHHPVLAGFSLRGLPTNASLGIILSALFYCKHFIPQLNRGIHASFLSDFF
jgi:hypothetical protein